MPWNSTWENLGGPPPSGRCLHGVAAVPGRSGAVEVFTLASDSSMYHIELHDAFQSAWHNLDRGDRSRIPWRSKPAACATGPATDFHIFAIDSFGELMHKNAFAAQWEIVEHKREYYSPPGVAMTSEGLFEIFLFSAIPQCRFNAVGAALHHLVMAATTSGVVLRSHDVVDDLSASARLDAVDHAPAAVSGPGGRLDVFWIEQGPGRRIQHARRDGNAWRIEDLGGTGIRGVAACSRFTGGLDVFTIGTDSALYQNAFAGAEWTDWRSLGGLWISPPAVVSTSPDRMHLFAIGADSHLYHNVWFDPTHGSLGHPAFDF